jgi:hypothetical protein
LLKTEPGNNPVSAGFSAVGGGDAPARRPRGRRRIPPRRRDRPPTIGRLADDGDAPIGDDDESQPRRENFGSEAGAAVLEVAQRMARVGGRGSPTSRSAAARLPGAESSGHPIVDADNAAAVKSA